MKLLLHTCCGPCLIYPLSRLKEKGFEVTGFFYNPNIHPFQEYKNRKEALELLRDGSQTKAKCVPTGDTPTIELRTVPTIIEVIYPEYEPSDFFQAVNQKEISLTRCSICWSLRLKKTAQAAKECGFVYFSTTLLVSPYQDQGLLKDIGTDISKELGVAFYYEDFRPGFREAHRQAHSLGIYCQKYCGCIYSEMERSKVKSQKSKVKRSSQN